jgi:hypothetical protein
MVNVGDLQINYNQFRGGVDFRINIIVYGWLNAAGGGTGWLTCAFQAESCPPIIVPRSALEIRSKYDVMLNELTFCPTP